MASVEDQHTPKRAKRAQDRPIFILAHGAGTNSQHPAMKHWQSLLENSGDVVVFDYKKPFTRHKGLVDTHVQAIESCDSSKSIFLIGPSMGGRISWFVTIHNHASWLTV
jgi:predicted alpha/beta-hydrolase family hydrolase